MTVPNLYVLENVSDLLDRKSVKKIRAVYADKSYDARHIRDYLKKKNITLHISKKNFKKNKDKQYDKSNQGNYHKTRLLKNGSHMTRIRCEKKCDTVLGLFIWHVTMY